MPFGQWAISGVLMPPSWTQCLYSRNGVFDTFAAESGRQAHLQGRIAAALMANAAELLAKPPQIERIDVLAATT